MGKCNVIRVKNLSNKYRVELERESYASQRHEKFSRCKEDEIL